MAKIYLIRHGQTDFNVRGVFAGQIETDLTELGQKQALQTALDLKEKGVAFDVILSSTLKRAIDTTKIIAGLIPSLVVYNDGLKEFAAGIYEGIKIDDLKKIHFDPAYKTGGFEFENGADLYAAYSSFDKKYDALCFPEGETKQEARERFMTTIQNYLDTHKNVQTLGVVAHGAVIRFMLLKVCPETINEKIKNAEVREIFYEKEKGFYIEKG